MEIRSPSGQSYEIGAELGKNEQFKLYRCQTGDNKACILKIARKQFFNGLLDKEAFLLQDMEREAKEWEEEYSKHKKSDKLLNYQFYFPLLLESFISKEQENSRINILSFSHIAQDLGDLTPLVHLRSREHVRVDPRTSAWILGKLLKMLVFTQSLNISNNNLTGSNILIHRQDHYVSLFDWSEAILGNGEMSEPLAAQEIAQVTKQVVLALGGNAKTGKLLPDKQLPDSRYENFLRQLLEARFGDASKAHADFYTLIRDLWPREFHPFRTYITTTQ